jgi:hypothetical protein
MSSRTSRGSRRRRRTRINHEAIAAQIIVVAAGVGGAMAGGHSTGWPVTDRLFAGLFAALVAAATSRARRWSWLVVSGGAALCALSADNNIASAMAFWSIVLAFGSVVVNKRDRAIGALVGGLAIQALLRLRGFGDSGVSALLTFAITAPALLSAYRVLPEPAHRRVRRGVLIGAGLAVLLSVPVVLGAIAARSHIEQGIQEVRAGFSSAESGDKKGATAHFNKAEVSFKDARKYVDSWWSAPARAVPVSGLQAQVLAVATHEGDTLARIAANLSNTEQAALSVEKATVSIDAIGQLTEPLNQAGDALVHASNQIDDVQSSFLLPPLSDKLDQFTHEVDRALPAAQNAKTAIRVAPSLLGNDAPRRYLVLFTTPAETRGTGGFIGSWALLTVDHGHIEMTDSGRITELNNRPLSPRLITGPERYLTSYVNTFHPEVFFQNITASPDFPDVANVATQLAPQTKLGAPIDGVILIDPIGLAAMLKLTGPVKVAGLSQPLTAENAAHVFLFDQYQLFPNRASDDPTEAPGTREGFLANALKATFDSFLGGNIPTAQSMVNALSPMVDQRRVLAYSTHPDEEALFRELGMDGSFPTPDTGDFISLVTTNRGGNKLDAYLHRQLTYDVTYSPSSGDVQATATVVLRNDAPPDGLPFEVGYNDANLPIGTNQTSLTLYSPLDLVGLSGNGQPYGAVPKEEFGFHSYTAYVDLPPGGSTTLVFSLAGSSKPAHAYRLRISPQPLVNADDVAVSITATDGWRPEHQPGVQVKDATATPAVNPRVSSDLTVRFN